MAMTVMLHVSIALLSIIITTAAYVSPTQWRLRSSYGLAGLTLASGLYLVASQPAYMVHACTAGVVYLSVVALGIVLARRKFIATKAAQTSK